MDGPVALISLLSFSTIVAALYDPVLQARLAELKVWKDPSADQMVGAALSQH